MLYLLLASVAQRSVERKVRIFERPKGFKIYRLYVFGELKSLLRKKKKFGFYIVKTRGSDRG